MEMAAAALGGSHAAYLCHVLLCESDWYSSRAQCMRTNFKTTHPLLLEWGHNCEISGIAAFALTSRGSKLAMYALLATAACATMVARIVLLPSRTALVSRTTRCSSGLAAFLVWLPSSEVGMWTVAAAHAHAVVVPCNALARSAIRTRCDSSKRCRTRPLPAANAENVHNRRWPVELAVMVALHVLAVVATGTGVAAVSVLLAREVCELPLTGCRSDSRRHREPRVAHGVCSAAQVAIAGAPSATEQLGGPGANYDHEPNDLAPPSLAALATWLGSRAVGGRAPVVEREVEAVLGEASERLVG